MRFEELNLAKVYRELRKNDFLPLPTYVARDWDGSKVKRGDYRVLQLDNRTFWQRMFKQPISKDEQIIAWVLPSHPIAHLWGLFFVWNGKDWLGEFRVMRRHIEAGYSLGNIIHEAMA